jgi:hypothetical protein
MAAISEQQELNAPTRVKFYFSNGPQSALLDL